MRWTFVLILFSAVRLAAAPAQLRIEKLSGMEIAIDGDTGDAAWQRATRVDGFVEYFRGDNTAPPATTVAYLAYDDEALYAAFVATDPDPRALRAPLVDRDKVLGDQDYVAILLDTENDRRSGVAFRVNPRGVQADSVVNDTTGVEDFAPDFFYEAVARRTPEGWSAELRIPLSSLRYPAADRQTWGVILMRNYPRDFRYVMSSTPIPKNSGCFVCHAAVLTGLGSLPAGSHMTLAPYVSGASPLGDGAPADARGVRRESGVESNAGLDVKWTPSASLTLDATVNPDFSQLEADVPQLALNNPFALSNAEKRTFFLEGTELLTTPLRAVYTRAIHAPAWGVRATGEAAGNAYTILLAEDAGGGVTIQPGPYGSKVVARDERSHVLIGRVRRGFGDAYAGLLATAREVGGGGHNRLLGPDFVWKVSPTQTLAGQTLFSDTDGTSGHASRYYYTRDEKRWDWYSAVRVISPGFRADNGFMPMAGVEEAYAELAGRVYPSRAFAYVRPYLGVAYAREYDGGDMIWTQLHPGVYFQGKWGSEGWVTFRAADRERVRGNVASTSFVQFSVSAAPFRALPAVKLEGSFGEKIDYATGRTGDGAKLSLSTTFRPTDHLELQAMASREWLDVDAARVFTSEVGWLKATYTFSPRSLVRVIAQRQSNAREGLGRDRTTALSAMYGWKLNWQTVFFVGYGDDALFAKVAYAFQR